MAHFLTKSFILCLILFKACSLYQAIPTYWYQFIIPRTDTLTSVSKFFDTLKSVTLLECTLKCHLETGGRCVAFHYLTNYNACQLFDNYGIGFKFTKSSVYYQNVKLPDTEDVNLALNKTVFANGDCDLKNAGQAQTLTDGSSDHTMCPCINLNQKSPRWFVVDLDRIVEVRLAVITTSTAQGGNANHFIIGLMKTFNYTAWTDSGIGPYTLCAQYPDNTGMSESYAVLCQGNPGGVQFVALIQTDASKAFAICEIQVYGNYVTLA